MHSFDQFKVQIDKVEFGIATPKWSKTRFPYTHHRIYYVVDGGAILKLNDSVHTLKPGYVYLLPAFSMVETICDDYMDHYYIHFQFQQKGVIDLFDTYEPKIELKATKNMEDLFEEMKLYYRDSSPHSSMITLGAFYQLLAPFFNGCKKPSDNVLRFEPVLNYIEHNLEAKLTTGQLAKILDLDPVYFANLFSSTLGIPPTQYIIKKRLEHAQTLLTSTNMKVKEIAEASGIDNPMYFSKLFKDKIGMTPGAYRKL